MSRGEFWLTYKKSKCLKHPNWQINFLWRLFMDILALHLSPRRNGNSADMLKEFLRGTEDGGASATYFSVSDLKIEPCIGCAACEETGKCILPPDDMEKLYPLLATAPMVVVATSLFFYDVPAIGKALIDRTQALWSQRYRLERTDTLRPQGKGYLLALGATKGKDLFVPVELATKYFFDAIGMPRTFEKLCFREIDTIGSFVKCPDLMAQTYQAGLEFAKQKQ